MRDPFYSDMLRRRRSAGAFTLVELMVAITITVVMLGFIWVVFGKTQQVVSRGIHMSDVISESRAVSTQLQMDFTGSAGGGSAAGGIVSPWNTASGQSGFLVIINRYATNPAPLSPDGSPVYVRDDQICFIEQIPSDLGSNDIAVPLTPMNGNTYAPNPYATAKYAKVWYGHVRKTNAQGTAVGNNVNAYNWILGRQAMFLMNFLNYPKLTSAGTTMHVDTPYANAPVINPISGSPPAYELPTALADVVAFNNSGAPPNGPFYVVLSKIVGTPPLPNSDYALYNGMGAGGYVARAMDMMYVGSRRLWVNPRPDISGQGAIQPWQVAQMAPMLAQNVSDFCVDFAGDYGTNNSGSFTPGTPDGHIDRDSGGSIIWYSGINNVRTLPDGTPIKHPAVWPVLNDTDAGNLNFNTGNTFDNAMPIYDPGGGSVFVFRHDDTSATNAKPGDANYTHWPWLLRIRYRIHDYSGQLGSRIQAIDNNTGNWTSKQVPGKWFSVIVPLKGAH